MNKPGEDLLFVYEPEQVAGVRAHAAGKTVVALDYEVELDLKKQGIAFVSIRDLASSPEGMREPVELARKLSMAWYRSPELNFFQHKGVLLGEPHKGPLHYYFDFLLYYLVLIDQVLSRPGIRRVSIFESFENVPLTADPTAVFKVRLPADVLKLLAQRRDIECEIIKAPLLRRAGGRFALLKRRILEAVFRVVVGTLNALVEVSTKPRPVKLFVTDPWTRIEPFIKQMPDVELVIARRQDIRAMGLATIWRTRARFHHRMDFANGQARAVARQKALECARAWDTLGDKPALLTLFVYKGVSFWPVVEPLLKAVVKEHTADAVATIESTERLFRRYGINCILLFSSLKGYNNLIAQLAETTDIPSIEMQHALELTEPSHPYSALHSRYLAAYGPLTQKNYERFGVASWRVVPCGSPRFDHYARAVSSQQIADMRAKLNLGGSRLNALVLLHSVYSPLEPGEFTAYSANDYLKDLAALQSKKPTVRFLLRPHTGDMGEKFYGRAGTFSVFPGDTRIVHAEDLHMLLALSDIVIAGYTTVVLEALIMHKPVLMYLPKEFEQDFKAFEDAGAVRMARSVEELCAHVDFLSDPGNRAAQVARADHFLAQSYIADGNAANRVVDLIRRVAKTGDAV